MWATMPEALNTEDLLAKALTKGVAFVPGTAAYVDGRGINSMRLNFSGVTEERIIEGIRRIGEAAGEQAADDLDDRDLPVDVRREVDRAVPLVSKALHDRSGSGDGARHSILGRHAHEGRADHVATVIKFAQIALMGQRPQQVIRGG